MLLLVSYMIRYVTEKRRTYKSRSHQNKFAVVLYGTFYGIFKYNLILTIDLKLLFKKHFVMNGEIMRTHPIIDKNNDLQLR